MAAILIGFLVSCDKDELPQPVPPPITVSPEPPRDDGDDNDTIPMAPLPVLDFLPDDIISLIDQEPHIELGDPCNMILSSGIRLCDWYRYQGTTYEEEEARMMEDLNRGVSLYHHSRSNPYQGMTSFQTWQALESALITRSRVLVNRSLYNYPDEGHLRPAHQGIAYVYGSKTFQTRRNALNWGGCAENLYGLDCSGFVQDIFHKARITTFPEGNAINQGTPQTIQQALGIFSETSTLTVHDMGKLHPNLFISGDIVSWDRLSNGGASHVGIVGREFPSSHGLVVFQSNGSVNSGCVQNYGSSRGARVLALDNTYWFGSSARWRVARIIPSSMNSNTCVTLTMNCMPDIGNVGSGVGTPQVVMNCSASGGTPPYQYSFNGGSFQSSNQAILHSPGSVVCTVRDALGCEFTRTM